MTFNEFILECENYQYSQENYNFMKECFEAQMLAKYISNQNYLSENYEDLVEDGMFAESYFGESVDADTYENLNEKFTEKIKDLGKQIGKILKQVWNAIVTFFTKAKKKFDKFVTPKPRSVYEVDAEYVEKVQNAYKRLTEEEKEILKEKIDFPHEMKFKYAKGVSKLSKEEIKFVEIAMNEQFAIYHKAKKGEAQVISVEYLDFRAGNGDTSLVKLAVDSIEKGVAEAKEDGIKFNFSQEAMDKKIETLKKNLEFIKSADFGNMFVNASKNESDYTGAEKIQTTFTSSSAYILRVASLKTKAVDLAMAMDKLPVPSDKPNPNKTAADLQKEEKKERKMNDESGKVEKPFMKE